MVLSVIPKERSDYGNLIGKNTDEIATSGKALIGVTFFNFKNPQFALYIVHLQHVFL